MILILECFLPFVTLPLALGIGSFHLQPASWAPPAALTAPPHLISQEAIGFLRLRLEEEQYGHMALTFPKYLGDCRLQGSAR